MKNIFFWCLLFIFQLSMAQEVKVQGISLDFENKSAVRVLQEIEDQTSYKFFFLEEWLQEYNVSGHFQNTDLEEVLTHIFQNTVINFFQIDEERIILTRNNIIYDEVAKSLAGPREDKMIVSETPIGDVEPVFKPGTAGDIKEGTIYIGKEIKGNNKRSFRISGYITDADTGRRLPDVSILVRERGTGTTTNNEGYYELQLPAGQHLLETSSLESTAYRRQIVIFNDGRLDIELEENLQQLGEIVVAANSNRNVKQAITGIEQINVAEIKTIPLVLGERDIIKVATTLPGISTAGEGAAGFNVRGGRADQNLILLDDAVIYNPAHFFGIFSAINPFTSGEVNIYKGSIPAEYGGRLSSVFDIKTRKGDTEKFTGEASIGPVTSSLSLEIPVVKEKSALLVGGRSTYSDWILNTLDDPALQNTRASFYDIIAKYHHKIDEKSDIEATGYFSRDVFSITSDSLFSYENRLGSLKFNHRFDEKNRGAVILTNSNYKFNIDYQGEANNNFTSGYNINETELKLHLNYLYSDKHDFNYGVSAKLYGVEPGQIRPDGRESLVEPFDIAGERGLETAIYIGDDFTVNEKLLINAGFRYSFFTALGPGEEARYREGLPRDETTVEEILEFDDNEVIKTYGGPELRLSARYFLGRELSAKASYNTTYQYIHTLSNNTTVSPTDTYKLSDGNIRPQTATQYSLGLYRNFDNDMFETSVEGYYRTLDNMLDFKVGAQLFLNENIETEVLQGEGKAYGVEFLLKKTRGKLNGWIGYSYSRSFIKLDSDFREERVNNGEFFPANFDKPHDLSIVANYKLTKRFSLSANFIYQTGRPVTFPIGKYTFNGAEYVTYSDRNQFRIPDYYRLDLSLNIEGNHRIQKFAHSFWNISVYNVLGRNNPYSVFFITDNGEVKAYQSSIFSIPIPTITYNFKF
ncbi:TonB-dependent receptor [Antarcticibacterium flavum]|uniref:TonB-dependent receptor n=1 Tax=Antarcticibacterium flavum TaxID=2058175 RepID=A0A5B7X6M9_9FLAO|nr:MULTISPECIES: TonB-dependent receptor [Antarcticibacterium]MCM4158567.1 TonB-dependent receptor [Antarcticibacterium sp. W02-3]QCY70311.1 TonB-dependent receptor [Antarcticibacterium flavum]